MFAVEFSPVRSTGNVLILPLKKDLRMRQFWCSNALRLVGAIVTLVIKTVYMLIWFKFTFYRVSSVWIMFVTRLSPRGEAWSTCPCPVKTRVLVVTQSHCVYVICHHPLEVSKDGIQFFFQRHYGRATLFLLSSYSTHKITYFCKFSYLSVSGS